MPGWTVTIVRMAATRITNQSAVDFQVSFPSGWQTANTNSTAADEAAAATLEASNLEGAEQKQLESELRAFRDELGTFGFARTRTYYELPEKKKDVPLQGH